MGGQPSKIVSDFILRPEDEREHRGFLKIDYKDDMVIEYDEANRTWRLLCKCGSDLDTFIMQFNDFKNGVSFKTEVWASISEYFSRFDLTLLNGTSNPIESLMRREGEYELKNLGEVENGLSQGLLETVKTSDIINRNMTGNEDSMFSSMVSDTSLQEVKTDTLEDSEEEDEKEEESDENEEEYYPLHDSSVLLFYEYLKINKVYTELTFCKLRKSFSEMNSDTITKNEVLRLLDDTVTVEIDKRTQSLKFLQDVSALVTLLIKEFTIDLSQEQIIAKNRLILNIKKDLNVSVLD
jgi:hypothetical protein